MSGLRGPGGTTGRPRVGGCGRRTTRRGQDGGILRNGGWIGGHVGKGGG